MSSEEGSWLTLTRSFPHISEGVGRIADDIPTSLSQIESISLSAGDYEKELIGKAYCELENRKAVLVNAYMFGGMSFLVALGLLERQTGTSFFLPLCATFFASYYWIWRFERKVLALRILATRYTSASFAGELIMRLPWDLMSESRRHHFLYPMELRRIREFLEDGRLLRELDGKRTKRLLDFCDYVRRAPMKRDYELELASFIDELRLTI